MKQDREQICPVVSVVISTYNRSEMLRRAVRSVLGQTYTDFELIIVSDGSTDDTPAVVSSWKDPRIRFIEHSTQRGGSAAYNTGMRAARGRFIACLDDDDEWLHRKLEIQVPVIEKSAPEVGLVYTWMEVVRGEDLTFVLRPRLRGHVFVAMLDKQAIGGAPTIIIKREVLQSVGYFDEELLRGVDGDYWRRISMQYHVDYVPEVLARVHTEHSDRISTHTREHVMNGIASHKKRLKLFE